AGRVVRRFSSSDQAPVDSGLNIPDFWKRPFTRPATDAGMHRFVWDLHDAPPAALEHNYPISAIAGDTPREPRGPWVLPGTYTVRLSAAGHAIDHPLVIRMDPRVHVTALALGQQHALATRITAAMTRDTAALFAVRVARDQVKARRAQASGAASDSLDAIDQRLAAIETGAGGPRSAESLMRVNGELTGLLDSV